MGETIKDSLNGDSSTSGNGAEFMSKSRDRVDQVISDNPGIFGVSGGALTFLTTSWICCCMACCCDGVLGSRFCCPCWVPTFGCCYGCCCGCFDDRCCGPCCCTGNGLPYIPSCCISDAEVEVNFEDEDDRKFWQQRFVDWKIAPGPPENVLGLPMYKIQPTTGDAASSGFCGCCGSSEPAAIATAANGSAASGNGAATAAPTAAQQATDATKSAELTAIANQKNVAANAAISGNTDTSGGPGDDDAADDGAAAAPAATATAGVDAQNDADYLTTYSNYLGMDAHNVIIAKKFKVKRSKFYEHLELEAKRIAAGGAPLKLADGMNQLIPISAGGVVAVFNSRNAETGTIVASQSENEADVSVGSTPNAATAALAATNGGVTPAQAAGQAAPAANGSTTPNGVPGPTVAPVVGTDLGSASANGAVTGTARPAAVLDARQDASRSL